VPIFNSLDEFKEIVNNINNNEKVGKIIKPSLIFVVKIINIQPFSQLLEKITIGNYKIKIINNEQVKI